MHRIDVKEKHKNSLNRPETKEKQRIAKIGKGRPKKLCIFCNKEISDNNYAKYHGNNCKLKNSNDE